MCDRFREVVGCLAGEAESMLALKARPPRVPPGLVVRPRLVARLTAAALHPLTVVSAGPGAGKTLTTASWAASAVGPRVAWLTLDHSDDDLRSFWSNLIAALIAGGGVPPDSALRDMAPAAEFGDAELAQIRDRLAQLPGPVLIILDDFHEITDQQVLESVDRLINRQPPSLRLILLSRADPALKLHQLRLDGDLTEIGALELAFTHAEIAALFNTSGIGLRADQITVLRDRTEGWPAGVRLAALSLDSDDVDAGIERFSGTDRSVAQYLGAEVTARLSPADRDFLLRTSVMDRISGPLAGHLTGRTDSQRVLEGFVAANAFVVTLGTSGEWFSYHPLLRQMMRHRLALEQPETAIELHRRVAEWSNSNGAPIDAIRHWILAGDLQAAGRTLLGAIPMILSREAPALSAAIEPLALAAQSEPSLYSLLAAAAYHFHRHEYVAMLRDTMDAGDYLSSADEASRPAAETALVLCEMAAARFRGDSAATARLAARAVEILDATPRQRIPIARPARVVADINLAGAQLWTGLPSGAAQILEAAAAEAAQLKLPLPQLNAIGHLSLLDALHGQCRRASRRSTLALQIADRRGWNSEPQALAAFLSAGLVELSRHRPAAAGVHLAKGLAASGSQTDRALRLALGIATVQAAVSRADIDGALRADARVTAGLDRTPGAADVLRRWGAVAGAEVLVLAARPGDALDRIGTLGAVDDFISSQERICLARAHFALGQLSAAQKFIEPLLKVESPCREPAVAAHLIQALIADRNRADTAALAAVTAAVELAHEEDIRRPFLLLQGRLPELLVRYVHLGGPRAEFVTAIVEQLAPRAEGDGESLVVDHLTEREMTVLRFLPGMLKAGEIAADLYVSVNTVKAHQRSIYRKLNAATRREAVERARGLGLL